MYVRIWPIPATAEHFPFAGRRCFIGKTTAMWTHWSCSVRTINIFRETFKTIRCMIESLDPTATKPRRSRESLLVAIDTVCHILITFDCLVSDTIYIYDIISGLVYHNFAYDWATSGPANPRVYNLYYFILHQIQQANRYLFLIQPNGLASEMWTIIQAMCLVRFAECVSWFPWSEFVNKLVNTHSFFIVQ